MKRKKFLIVLFAVIATVSAILGLCGCNSCGNSSGYTISVDQTKPTTIYVGDTIDYTQYFIVKDKDGHQIMVTNDMLDLSQVDTSKDGVLFTVTLEVGGAKESIDFVVAKKDDTVVSGGYTISVNTSKSTTLTIGSTVDFTQYFIVKDKNGLQITVTNDMLDLSKVNTSKAGTFTVTLSLGGASKSVTFTVKASGSTDTPSDLSAILAKYSDSSNWNFAVTVLDKDNTGEYGDIEEYYEYFGDLVLRTYEDESYNQVTGYLEYAGNSIYCYLPDSDGKYVKYDESSTEMSTFYGYSYIFDLTPISDYTFTAANGYYTASNPSEAGNAMLGDYGTSATWKSFDLYVSNGNITKIVAVIDFGSNSTDTMTYTFSKHGQINFTIPESTDSTGSGLPTEPTGTMESQTYNPDTFDDGGLQDKTIDKNVAGNDAAPAIGLPSTGNVTALVVPIKFSDTEIKQTQLDNLNLAFNGTADDTGWESVKSYYYKSSYEKLNLSFDIAGVNLIGDNSTSLDYFTASKPSTWYEQQTTTDQYGNEYKNGDNLLLHEVLKYYESRLDLNKYDTNGDGYIDAVYLIYSAEVDFEQADFWWAFVTWNFDETTYDGLGAYYYMFTGLDFMTDALDSYHGMTINAETYIHETGHLLGLDDYYDYETSKGSNLGLGGADMMDWNNGDHGAYSKIMLGWMTPQIIVPSATNPTTTVTIKSLQEKGDAILIPLNFNNSYFCEYLLVDLYSNKGLNEAASKMTNTIMYDGAEYGVRIYHVSSWINDPWNNDYGSFTDNNNSSSSIPLIRLIEADGGNSTSSTSNGGWASESDLWQAGQSLSKVFDQFMTYDGKLLNFDITIDSIDTTAGTATITIAYNA